MRSIVIHYQEIALKGKNRPWFISRLVNHVKLATADLDVCEVRSIMGRIEPRQNRASSTQRPKTSASASTISPSVA